MSRFSAALFFSESFRATFDFGLVLASLFFFDRESDLLVPRMAFVILCSVDSFSFSRLPFAEEQDWLSSDFEIAAAFASSFGSEGGCSSGSSVSSSGMVG